MSPPSKPTEAVSAGSCLITACSHRASVPATIEAQQPETAASPAGPAGSPQEQHGEPRRQDGAAPPPCLQITGLGQLPPKRLRSLHGVSFYSSGRRGAASGSRRLPTAAEAAFEARLQRSLQLARERAERWKAEEADGLARAAHVWEEFPTQQPAFDRADSQPGLDVFSVEVNTEGKRRFIATSHQLFWKRYRDMLPEHRHYYEIIRQGRPCHLYFDLEFATADNAGLDGEAATDAVVALVREQLCSAFQLDLQPGWVLELDSSTEAKFSRHLVIRIPGVAFASSAHVGAFVLQLCTAAKERRGSDPRAALVVVKKGEEEALFIDPAVYSRNRAFRLYLSSKKGKEAVLQNTGRYGGAGLTQQQTFEASLITTVDPGARLLQCFEETAEEVAAGSAATRRRALHSGAQRGAGGSGHFGVAACYGPCPHPELETFITSVCREGGVQGRVRSWAALDDDLLLFTMRDNRFCGNIGRPHKSNGIYYVVDLRGGSWCQKCYDPECRHYRSPLAPLPPHLLGLAPPAQQADEQAPHQPLGPLHGAPRGMQRIGCLPSASSACCDSNSSLLGTSIGAQEQVEDEEESLMLLAVESYERWLAQQAQWAGRGQGQQAGSVDAAAAATGPTDDEDELLLQALLRYELQCGSRPPGDAATTASPAPQGFQHAAGPSASRLLPVPVSQHAAMPALDAHVAACGPSALQALPAPLQHPGDQQRMPLALQQQHNQQPLPQQQQTTPPQHNQQQLNHRQLAGPPAWARLPPHKRRQQHAWRAHAPLQQCGQTLQEQQLGELKPAAKPLQVWEKLL